MAHALPLRAPALALALAALAPAARAEVPVPGLTGPVVDEAGLLGRADVARLERLSRAARAASGGEGVQLQYLLVPSLDGEPIEELSMRVAEAWKLGSRDSDNGVLVTVARDERKVRIEVGGGLEGGLTDAQTARIIRDVIAPAFRQGQYGAGLHAAGVQILAALGALPEGVAAPAARSRPGVHLSSLGVAAFVVFFLVLRIALGFGVRRRRSLWGLPFGVGGGRWGGGGGWGSFGGGGGGGWSGGGGGFSGGGSSGSW